MQQPPQYTITTSQPGTVNITANAPPFQYNPYPNAAAAAPHTANASKFTGGGGGVAGCMYAAIFCSVL